MAAALAALLPAAATAQGNAYDTYGWAVVGGGCNNGAGSGGSIRVVKQVAPDLLVLGGNFATCYDNMTRSYAIPGTRHIAFFNLTDETYSAVGGGFTLDGVSTTGGIAGVYSIVQNGSDLYVAGNFQAALVNASLTSKVPLTKGIAKWSLDARAWSAVGMAASAAPSKAGPFGGALGYPLSLALNGSDLFAGGSFDRVYTRTGADQPRTASIAKWNASSNQWGGIGYYGHPTFQIYRQFNGAITDIAVTGSLLLLAGGYTAFYLPSPNNVEVTNRGSTNQKTIHSCLGTGGVGGDGALFCQGTAFWNASSRTLGCLGGGCGFATGSTSGVTVVDDVVYWYGQFDSIMGTVCNTGGSFIVSKPTNAGNTAVATFDLGTRQWRAFQAGISAGTGVLVRQSTRSPERLFVALYNAGVNGFWRANTTVYTDSSSNPDSFSRMLITTFNTTTQQYAGLPYYTTTSTGTALITSSTWSDAYELEDGTVYLAGTMGTLTAGGNFIRSTLILTPSPTTTSTTTPTMTKTGSATTTSSRMGTPSSSGSKTGSAPPTTSKTGSAPPTSSQTGTASSSETASGTASSSGTASGTTSSSEVNGST